MSDGGYCSKCDTIYDRLHECKGKQMSVERLNFYYPPTDSVLIVSSKENDQVRLTLKTGFNNSEIYLNRNQADLLRLWLVEHLK